LTDYVKITWFTVILLTPQLFDSFNYSLCYVNDSPMRLVATRIYSNTPDTCYMLFGGIAPNVST